MKKNNSKIIIISLINLYFLSSVRFIDSAGWLADYFSHFPFQYALISFVIMSVCIRKKMTGSAVLSGILFLFNIGAIIDFQDTTQAAVQVRPTFKVYSANINIHNDEISELNIEIRKVNPEIVLLLEVTSKHVEQIQSVKQIYPYHVDKIPDEVSRFGFVFLSKFPVLGYRVTNLSDQGNSILEATVEINKTPVVFYGTHAQKPDIVNLEERRNQFLWLAEQIKNQTSPVIVAGDLNTTPYSPVFRELLTTARLKDSREGFGWQPSWPAYLPFLLIPIDHILVSSQVKVHGRATGSFIGSDHFPVLAELSIY